MIKPNIVWLLALLAGLVPPQASAVELSFGFPLELTQSVCQNLPTCGTPTDPGTIFVTLDLADPFVDQTWGILELVTFVVAAPFPSFGQQLESTAEGTYTYDPITGRGTATVTSYEQSGGYSMAGQFVFQAVNTAQWLYLADGLSPIITYNGVPGELPVALTLVGPPVPLPPTMLFLASGFLVLMFRRWVTSPLATAALKGTRGERNVGRLST